MEATRNLKSKLQKLTPQRRQKILNRLALRITDIHIGFEDIYDPHNIMAATRNIDAFGLQNVHLIFDQQKPFNPKKIGKKTSASANRWLSFKKHKSPEEAIAFFRKHGFQLIATVVDHDATPLPQFQWSSIKKPFVILFGNEHRGLSKKLIKASDYKLFIPMYGFVESFNLSVAVGIVLYDLSLKLRGPQQRTTYKQDIEKFLNKLTTEKRKILQEWL